MYKVHIAWCDCSGSWTSYLKPCILSSCYGPQWSHCITKSTQYASISSSPPFLPSPPKSLTRSSMPQSQGQVIEFLIFLLSSTPLSHRKFGTRQGACMKMCTQRPKGGGPSNANRPHLLRIFIYAHSTSQSLDAARPHGLFFSIYTKFDRWSKS